MVRTSFDRVNALFDHRFASRPSSVVLAEIFLGVGWLRAVVAKAVDPEWWSGTLIEEFVADHRGQTIGWFQPIADHVIFEYSLVWAFVVVGLELMIGIALLTAVRIKPALAAAIFLNVNFVLIGMPNPSVFYLILQFGLVLWLLEASPATNSSARWLRGIIACGVILTFVLLPSVGTIDPDRLVDDPASVLAAWSSCGVVAAVVAQRRVGRKQVRQADIDLTMQEADRVTQSL